MKSRQGAEDTKNGDASRGAAGMMSVKGTTGAGRDGPEDGDGEAGRGPSRDIVVAG